MLTAPPLRCKQLHFAAATDMGLVRSENQDRWVADAELGFFAVADGMGGHAAGAFAAQLVVDALPQLARRVLAAGHVVTAEETASALVREVGGLSDAVRDETWGRPGVSGTGTTLVLAMVDEQHATIIHAGDSRAYLFRTGKLCQLTRDHTLAQLLADQEGIFDAGMHRSPAACKLTRYIGMPGGTPPDAQIVDFAAGDVLLLCSDGLHGQVDDSQIWTMLQHENTNEQKCLELIATASKAGGRDNATVVLISRMG